MMSWCENSDHQTAHKTKIPNPLSHGFRVFVMHSVDTSALPWVGKSPLF